MSGQERVFWSLVLLTTCSFKFSTRAFNVASRHPIIFSDNTQGQSYFGFSVGLLTNSDGSWVLVGAPRANSSFDFIQQVKEPGVIYKCSVSSTICQEIPFQRKSKEPDNRPNMRYVERRSNGWLGVSLDVADTVKPNVMACGHLWKSDLTENWLTNGMCYVVDHELSSPSIKRLLPLTDSTRRIYDPETYWYAYGLLGFSSHFAENTDDIVLGAPGVLNWKGTLVFSQEPEYNRPKSFQSFHVPLSNSKLAINSYFGYSVSSGIFFNADETQLVAGAPRDGAAGSVYIVEMPTIHSPQDEEALIRAKFEGTQMGEYFGASVCAVDVNNDKLSDLLVGAPLHSIEQEEGVVYVYMNTPEGRLSSAINLVGSVQPRARFGTAISNVGDLDQDGFNDVVIGAPYEDGVGAIYVYRGSSKGLVESQQIVASEIDLSLRGFGISISRGKDIDENFYPDLAVGAYDSSHTVLLRSLPVVKLQPTLSFNISQVNLNSPSSRFQNESTASFSVTACIVYTGKNVVSQLAVTSTISIGTTKRKENRAFLVSGGDPVRIIRRDVALSKDVPNCKSYEGHVLSSSLDLITPIQFNSKVELLRNPRNEPRFCKECPVTETEEEAIVSESLSFVVNCGEDQICDSDLSVQSKFNEIDNDNPFIIGSTSTLTLMTEVTNNGPDPAYLTRATITLPPLTTLSTLNSNCLEIPEDPSSIICNLGNPIKAGDTVTLRIIIDASEVKLQVDALNFVVNVTTMSNDVNEDNNLVNLFLPLASDVDVTVIGKTETEHFVVKKESMKNESLSSPIISHTYQVFVYGYSAIDSVTLEMQFPNTQDGQLVQILQAEPRLDGRLSHFGSCSSVLSTFGDDENNTQSTVSEKNLKRTSLVNSNKNAIDVDCSEFPCVVVRCRLGPLIEREIASVTVAMQINLKTLGDLMKNKQSVRFISWANVVINDVGIEQVPNGLPDESEVITEFIKEGLPPAKELDYWIIPVCVIVGILLLILIVVVLAKLGFFRRKEKEELEKLSSTEADKNLLGPNGEVNNGMASSET